ncbi:hypothetical protein [Ureaplasma parvum]|mgnify:CR=1 FL=1|uniref:Uncharacterized protein n=1 Tax=Ureaplasma parvum TaxID=134821 RepID=A0AAC9T2A0_UREPR|nr:hypothetical protein [Ureaplasma parvum]ASD24750.1 hypothetical protein CEG38_02530 [Ureaplasma parvum]ASD24977.1 hypothetical protein CEE64_00595 [Ureaplasma parvum]ASD29067.1 hypothetical protein CEG40_03035 [Ureaplasma parvum]ASD30143.1 hypothetical protein CEG42_02910 [Ureaplasma parvum]EDT48808.1 hypothetical protein UPA1_G0116 [Ureaplasma parvum serovar 1 str. ATCC 27813]
MITIKKTNIKAIKPVLINRILFNDDLIYSDTRKIYRHLLFLLLKQYYFNSCVEQQKTLDGFIISLYEKNNS